MLDRRSRAILALLLGGAVLLNFPVLQAIDAWTGAGLGLPLYVFSAWALIIALAAWLVERRPPA